MIRQAIAEQQEMDRGQQWAVIRDARGSRDRREQQARVEKERGEREARDRDKRETEKREREVAEVERPRSVLTDSSTGKEHAQLVGGEWEAGINRRLMEED